MVKVVFLCMSSSSPDLQIPYSILQGWPAEIEARATCVLSLLRKIDRNRRPVGGRASLQNEKQ